MLIIPFNKLASRDQGRSWTFCKAAMKKPPVSWWCGSTRILHTNIIILSISLWCYTTYIVYYTTHKRIIILCTPRWCHTTYIVHYTTHKQIIILCIPKWYYTTYSLLYCPQINTLPINKLLYYAHWDDVILPTYRFYNAHRLQ